MNLFLHSFSFIGFDKSFSWFEPDYADMGKFDRFLASAVLILPFVS